MLTFTCIASREESISQNTSDAVVSEIFEFRFLDSFWCIMSYQRMLLQEIYCPLNETLYTININYHFELYSLHNCKTTITYLLTNKYRTWCCIDWEHSRELPPTCEYKKVLCIRNWYCTNITTVTFGSKSLDLIKNMAGHFVHNLLITVTIQSSRMCSRILAQIMMFYHVC